MTTENLITVREGVHPGRGAGTLLHRHRIERLIVVDDAYRCVGLITVKDMEKAQRPSATPPRMSRAACASRGRHDASATGLRARRWR
jgi:IMP dehydrogenase